MTQANSDMTMSPATPPIIPATIVGAVLWICVFVLEVEVEVADAVAAEESDVAEIVAEEDVFLEPRLLVVGTTTPEVNVSLYGITKLPSQQSSLVIKYIGICVTK